MSERTAIQNIRFTLLKKALEGDGPAIDKVFLTAFPEFGSAFVSLDSGLTSGAPASTQSATFVELASFQLVLPEAGEYVIDTSLNFEDSGASNNDLVHMQVFIAGQPIGEEIVAAAVDTVDLKSQITSFAVGNLNAGEVTVSLEGKVTDVGSPGVTLIVNGFRMKFTRTGVQT